MRRYFHACQARHAERGLFSAHAEVFPGWIPCLVVMVSLLRACGGISDSGGHYPRQSLSSPRMRRYFRSRSACSSGSHLFSAHAEVFPSWLAWSRLSGSLLRACGGISGTAWAAVRPICSSPRMRRYFQPRGCWSQSGGLFSAHAEVFLTTASPRCSRAPLLRACGGISE